MLSTNPNSIRERQFVALREELLGPRGKDAAYETIQNPKFEYVTGVLEPVNFNRILPGAFGSIDLEGLKKQKSAEEDSDDDIDDFDISSKLLHPLGLPKSIGISFILDKEKTNLDFCAIFARYFTKNNVRQRNPFVFIKKGLDATKNNDWSAPHGDVKIKLVSKKMNDGNFHVSLFLVNATDAKKKTRLDHSDYVFQPQIRINVTDYGALHPVRNVSTLNDKEEEQISFLYRNQKPLAKGHMTGAVWQEIDPERPFEGKDSSLIPPDMSGQVFKENNYPDEDIELFTNPHLRTDFLPSYSINQTTVGVSNIGGMTEKDMDAEILADGFDSQEFFDSLTKLQKAYSDWIENQDISALSEDEKRIAKINLDECTEASRRINRGIELLQEKKIRLAFCFMNKVMSIQAKWAGREKLVWRPFQLAFILQCLEGISRPHSTDRNICDLLWYPTGGGKTEAYLGILIFTLALRRLNRKSNDSTCYGTTAISRYTLRLLTLQQFRRTLSTITACELLRTRDWNPSDIQVSGEPIWGTVSFSVGLWVGGGLTPNTLLDRSNPGFNPVTKKPVRYVGAVSILTYKHLSKWRSNEETSYEDEEPAQVLKCPCCNKNLTIPKSGIHGNKHEIFLTIKCKNIPDLSTVDLNYNDITVTKKPEAFDLPNNNYHTLKLNFETTLGEEADKKINSWWKECIKNKIPNSQLECTAASRPGYFLKKEDMKSNNPYSLGLPYDVEIRCPNPDCFLNNEDWTEFVHTTNGKQSHTTVPEPFRKQGNSYVSEGIPIPAFLIDSQIYTKCPSLIVATVDKFAQLPILPQTAAMFGNVNMIDDKWGFYREKMSEKPEDRDAGNVFPISPFLPPEIILQDELHLIEGPLGSMVGLYETAIDILSTRYENNLQIAPKYLVSTATIRAAGEQIQSLYCRTFKQFPPSGLLAGKNFFSDADEAHPLDDQGPGRWYVGIMAPGRGPITPTTRIWASILQESQAIRGSGPITDELKYFWTVVGYFNAMRELAGIRAGYEQDIPAHVNIIASRNGQSPRHLSQLEAVELHSNIPDKTNISAVLDRLEKESMDAVFATSMFGTGVDVDRLSQMIVHGQPKTTSNYIQATGRVGRKKGALVVTFLRSTRSRDLDHYEFFTGYHRALHRHVEPLTVFPFSPGAVNKGLLPVMIAVLRNGMSINNIPINSDWAAEDQYKAMVSGSRRMATERQNSKELDEILKAVKKRNDSQPEDRIQPDKDVTGILNALISSWEIKAKKIKDLYYYERAFGRIPKKHVVLGDEKHKQAGLSSVNENTPNSLRDVESSMRFRD